LTSLAISSHVFWVTARAAGISALVLVSASVGTGVALSGRLDPASGSDLRIAHEALSLAAVVLIALHVLSLFGDTYFHPSVGDLVIPVELDYREPYMAIGIIGGWGTVVLGLSYYVRGLIGIARWKILHRVTAVAWVLSVIHTLGEGTDGGDAWFIAIVVLTVLPTLLLILVRLTHGRWPPSRFNPLARSLPRVRRSGM
jgi:sulfoxide reductase heme-binding subunit YedZ